MSFLSAEKQLIENIQHFMKNGKQRGKRKENLLFL